MIIEGDLLDVAIIGSGPAGLSAGLWCADLGLKALILERFDEYGGQLLSIFNRVENYIGLQAASGREVRDLFTSSLERSEVAVRGGSDIVHLDEKNRRVKLADGSQISAKALVIATGIRRRRLGIPGEAEFRSRGILESGAKEKEAVRAAHVVIVGGGDAALENAIILAEKASRVTIVHRRAEFAARPEFVGEVAALRNVEIRFETELSAINGHDKIDEVSLHHIPSGTNLKLSTDAVLIRIGVEPNNELIRDQLDLDERGYIRINAFCETSSAMIFAVGDIANPIAPTISTAAGMGATAVKQIEARLRRRQ